MQQHREPTWIARKCTWHREHSSLEDRRSEAEEPKALVSSFIRKQVGNVHPEDQPASHTDVLGSFTSKIYGWKRIYGEQRFKDLDIQSTWACRTQLLSEPQDSTCNFWTFQTENQS